MRALTYCDLHKIMRDDLLEVLLSLLSWDDLLEVGIGILLWEADDYVDHHDS